MRQVWLLGLKLLTLGNNAPKLIIDIRNDFKKVGDLVNSGERVLIARPHNKNLVLLSEADFNELEKAKRNAEYIDKLNRSLQQLADGKVSTKTIEDLEQFEQHERHIG